MIVPTPPPEGTAEERNLAKQLILLICQKLNTSPTFASTVLAKVLYYIDREFYLGTGRQLTYFLYVKQKFGPTPSPAQFLSLREQMIEDGVLEIVSMQYYGQPQKKPVNTVPADSSTFTGGTLTKIEGVIDSFRFADATTASKLSHGLPWEVANMMEELPGFTFLATEADELNEGDIAWGMGEIESIIKSPA